MNTIKLNLDQGFIYVDSALVELDDKGVLIGPIVKLCSPPIHTDQGHIRYRLLNKISIFGYSADCVIEIAATKELSVTFLFDLITFFESSIFESKIIRAFEKSLKLKFTSNHPSKAFLDSCTWGYVIFSYDPKQGDLSLEIKYKSVSNEKNSKS